MFQLAAAIPPCSSHAALSPLPMALRLREIPRQNPDNTPTAPARPLHPTLSTSPLVPRTPLLRPILRNRGPQPAGLRPPRLSSAAVLPQKKTGRRSRPVFDKSVPRISSGLVVRHRTTTTFFATTRINRRPAALFSFDRVEHWKSRRSLVQRIDWPHH